MRRLCLAFAIVALVSWPLGAVVADGPPIGEYVSMDGSPIELSECAVDADTAAGWVMALRLQNHNDVALTGFTVRYQAFDASGVKMSEARVQANANLEPDQTAIFRPGHVTAPHKYAIARIRCELVAMHFARRVASTKTAIPDPDDAIIIAPQTTWITRTAGTAYVHVRIHVTAVHALSLRSTDLVGQIQVGRLGTKTYTGMGDPTPVLLRPNSRGSTDPNDYARAVKSYEDLGAMGVLELHAGDRATPVVTFIVPELANELREHYTIRSIKWRPS